MPGTAHPTASASPAATCRLRWPLFWGWWVLIGLGVAWTEANAAAPELEVTESQVKAAYLFNFVKFVEWPSQAFARPDFPFVIGIVGQNPFARALEQIISGEEVRNRHLVIRSLAPGDDWRGCHLLYIARSERTSVGRVLDTLTNAPVLTVGDSEDFARQGGMINFVMRDRHVRFEINLEAARRAGLRISSKLLNVALTVLKKNEPPSS